MAEPTSSEEYCDRFRENHQFHFIGGEVMLHVPCPFCAAPDWIRHAPHDTEFRLGTGAVCKECGRGAKVLFGKSADGHISVFETVQTVGPDPAEWVAIRRIPLT